MSVHVATWIGRCTDCGGEGIEVGSRTSHGYRVLCERCTARVYTMPTADGIDTGGIDTGVPNGELPRDATFGTPHEKPREHWNSGVPNGGATRVPVAPPAGAPKLRMLDVERMLTTSPAPVPWIVEPLLAKGCVTMLAGREGQGKSMLALALAAAIGHGADIAGFDCRPGRVLYVDAENGEREAHRRVHGLGVKPGRLRYVEAQGFSLTTDIALLLALVDQHAPSVLILDSLRSLAPGMDENDSARAEAALRPVAHLAQHKGLPVLLLAHAGKAGLEYRGSTAIGAAVELGFTLARHPDDPHGRTRRRLTCWKSRPAPEPDARWIQLEARDGGILVAEAEPFDASASRRDDAGAMLRDSLTDTPTSWAVWARAAGLDPKNGTARRARDQLQAEGLAENRAGGWVDPAAPHLKPVIA